MMITSRLTAKSQTTVPHAVRRALSLKPGDELSYAVEGDHVVLSKASRDIEDDPFMTFDEWSGEADKKAYADL